MILAALLKYLHILSAIWMVSGLLGRGLTQQAARASQDINKTTTLMEFSNVFEKYMVIPGSMVVLGLGLFTAWAQGAPLIGFLQGSQTNWLLASLVLYLTSIPIIPLVFLPRGKIFEKALTEAQVQNRVTPELKAAFSDRAVAAAHVYELVLMAVIIFLMSVKPF